MGQKSLALLLAALAACAVLVAKNTEHGRSFDEIYDVIGTGRSAEIEWIVAYDPKERISYGVSAALLGLSHNDFEKIRLGSRIICWYEWEKNLFTAFEVKAKKQCRLPPQKKYNAG